jgi:hypothetical protein
MDDKIMKNLIIDIDYQKQYDYEKRVDLFNKYGISVSEKFFVPIWGLANYITSLCGILSKDYYPSYGHGQSVLSNIDTKSEKSRIKTWEQNDNLIDIFYHFPNVERHEKYGNLRKVIRFNIKEKTISLNNHGHLSVCKIPRNLYQKIDEWLFDFGFENEW